MLVQRVMSLFLDMGRSFEEAHHTLGQGSSMWASSLTHRAVESCGFGTCGVTRRGEDIWIS